jgi:hypothetical protein
VRFLTQEWLDGARSLTASQPARPGATARIQFVITAGPDGDVKYSGVVEDGVLVAADLGTVPDPDLTITAPYTAWREVVSGERDLSVAFMQGVVKVAGDTGRFLRLLPITQTPELRALQEQLRATTDAD